MKKSFHKLNEHNTSVETGLVERNVFLFAAHVHEKDEQKFDGNIFFTS